MAAPETDSMRLQRFLAAAGIASRRKCEELIAAGRVEVDGQIVTEPGTKVVPGKNQVRVDTETVKLKPRRYYLLNKPTGVVCTHSDPAGRPRAVDLVPADGERLFTVGRLDENTEGLLLVTNDGELSQRLAHPRYEVLRTYRVQVAGDPGPEVFRQLRDGLHFREGKFRVHHVKRLKQQGQSTLLELQLSEGQNREIRRLLARVGHKVMKLQRVGFGPLRIGTLKPGEFRTLTAKERNELFEFAFTPPSKRRKTLDKHRVRERPPRGAQQKKKSTRRR